MAKNRDVLLYYGATAFVSQKRQWRWTVEKVATAASAYIDKLSREINITF
jgi:hypothetical protein